MMPLGKPSLPCPARPPMPRISPSLTSRLTLRTVSPGISTQRLRMLIIIFASASFTALAVCALETFRPTIHRAISGMVASPAATFLTIVPSRITTTWSQISRISCSLWVMKITAIPLCAIRRTEPSSASASCSVSTAVGSSSISNFSWSLLSSLAISVNCLRPMGMSLISIRLSMFTPTISIARLARSSMSFLSRELSRSENTWDRTLCLVTGSRLRRIFSVAVKPGISENSWCTMPMPAVKASKGLLKTTFCPLINISPP